MEVISQFLPDSSSNHYFIVNYQGAGGGGGTQIGGGIYGGVKPNLDQLIHLPGLDHDYKDDYLKGRGSGGGGADHDAPKHGGASPTSGFGSQKTDFKLQNGNAMMNGGSFSALGPSTGIKIIPSQSVQDGIP